MVAGFNLGVEPSGRELLVVVAKGTFRIPPPDAPDGIVLVDEEGTIVDVNPHALEMFDYERKDLVGERIELLVPERVRDAHTTERAAFMAQPRTRPMGIGLELRGRRRDGS